MPQPKSETLTFEDIMFILEEELEKHERDAALANEELDFNAESD